MLCYLRCTIAALLEAAAPLVVFLGSGAGCQPKLCRSNPCALSQEQSPGEHHPSLLMAGPSLEQEKQLCCWKEAEVRCLFQAGDDVLRLCAAALMFPLAMSDTAAWPRLCWRLQVSW